MTLAIRTVSKVNKVSIHFPYPGIISIFVRENKEWNYYVCNIEVTVDEK